MLKAGNKHPLKGVENAGPSRTKRRRFDNIVLLREEEENSDNLDNRQPEPQRQILRAGRKRKSPTEENGQINCLPSAATPASSSNGKLATCPVAAPENDENDIISELAKKFKKARLRPVFFTISSFIEQTVDEVGFTMADESETTEVTISVNFNLKSKNGSGSIMEDIPKENGKHFDDLDEGVPDLVKDCFVNCDSMSVNYEERDMNRIVSEETQHEINNNG